MVRHAPRSMPDKKPTEPVVDPDAEPSATDPYGTEMDASGSHPPRHPWLRLVTWGHGDAFEVLKTEQRGEKVWVQGMGAPFPASGTTIDEALARWVNRWGREDMNVVPLEVDEEIFDATDGAHPAWWRGHDHVAERMREQMETMRTERDAAYAVLASAARGELPQCYKSGCHALALVDHSHGLGQRSCDDHALGDGWTDLPHAALLRRALKSPVPTQGTPTASAAGRKVR
jgi:hypothetical protein